MSSMSTIDDFKTELSTLLLNQHVLPGGGYLGFGLEYAYPLSKSWNNLNNLKGCLKGVDADLMNVFQELALVTSFWSIIENKDTTFGCKNHIPHFEDEGYGKGGPDFSQWLVTDEKALVLEAPRPKDVDINANWVKDPVKARRRDKMVVNYGNEAHGDRVYHNVCLIVQVGRPGNRGIPNPEPLRLNLVRGV